NRWLPYDWRFCCKVFQKIYFSVKLRKKTERTE
ncbi:DNA transposition-like protein, partial [Staphylococcus pseudintermedius]